MSRELINGTVSIEVPEGFKTMSAEELQQAFQSSDPNRWGTWNRESHVILTVLWKESLLSGLADLKAVCKKNEQLSARGYAGHGYRCGGFFSAEAGGEKAEGYRFSYQVGETAQSAETVLFRQHRTIYSLTCIGRPENQAADHETLAGILAGMEFQGK